MSASPRESAAPERRTAAWLALLAALALAVPTLEVVADARLAHGSLAAVALLPYLALAPLPRGRALAGGAGDAGPALRLAALAGALLATPLALGAGIDLARGAPAGRLAGAALAGLASVLLGCAAAALAAPVPRARRAYALAWLVLVPGLAALELALEWVPLGAGATADAAAAGPGARAWSVAPLVACRRWGSAGGLASFPAADALAAPLAFALVLAAVLALRRGPNGGLRS